VATKKTTLLNIGIKSIPDNLERATWLNYVRCHDDIGWGFSDSDIIAAGYEPQLHRRFLVDYYTGKHAGSQAQGLAFGINKKNGDARISGSLASLAWLQTALEQNDPVAIDAAIKLILLLHSMIFSFGGIPLLYYGDAIGTLNDDSYLNDDSKSSDNRWVHRPTMDWGKAALRSQPGTVQFRIFSALKKMICVRKETSAFADRNNRQLLALDNTHLFAFSRFDQSLNNSRVLVIANFDTEPQSLALEPLRRLGFFQYDTVKDLYSGASLTISDHSLVIPPLGFYWLQT
jgi:amylosucrase